MHRNVEINNVCYNVIDAKEKMTVPDCWVLRNKIGTAHGEAKFFIGNESELLFNFFDDFTLTVLNIKHLN